MDVGCRRRRRRKRGERNKCKKSVGRNVLGCKCGCKM
jgi:hypothetical protein